MMNRTNFGVGMGMGLVVGYCAAMIMSNKKRSMKSTIGKTVKTISDVIDTISDTMGW